MRRRLSSAGPRARHLLRWQRGWASDAAHVPVLEKPRKPRVGPLLAAPRDQDQRSVPAFGRRTLLLELYGEERIVRERDLDCVTELCEEVLQALQVVIYAAAPRDHHGDQGLVVLDRLAVADAGGEYQMARPRGGAGMAEVAGVQLDRAVRQDARENERIRAGARQACLETLGRSVQRDLDRDRRALAHYFDGSACGRWTRAWAFGSLHGVSAQGDVASPTRQRVLPGAGARRDAWRAEEHADERARLLFVLGRALVVAARLPDECRYQPVGDRDDVEVVLSHGGLRTRGRDERAAPGSPGRWSGYPTAATRACRCRRRAACLSALGSRSTSSPARPSGRRESSASSLRGRDRRSCGRGPPRAR